MFEEFKLLSTSCKEWTFNFSLKLFFFFTLDFWGTNLEEKKKKLRDIHEALLPAGRLSGPRVRVRFCPTLLDPGARRRALILGGRRLLLLLLGLVQSVADEQALVGEVGQLGLPLQQLRDVGGLLTRRL